MAAHRVLVNQPRSGSSRQKAARRSWPILLPWAIPVAVFVGVALYAAFTPYTTKREPPGKHGGLIWGDGTFSNQLQVSAWLRLHGGSYLLWKKRHPAALLLVTPRKRHPVRRAKAVHAPLRVKHVRTIHRVSPVAARRSSLKRTVAAGSSLGTNWLVIVLTSLGLLAAIAAVLPRAALARFGVLSARSDFRVLTAAVAVSILIGVATVALLE